MKYITYILHVFITTAIAIAIATANATATATAMATATATATTTATTMATTMTTATATATTMTTATFSNLNEECKMIIASFLDHTSLWTYSKLDRNIIWTMITNNFVHLAFTFNHHDTVDEIVTRKSHWRIPRLQFNVPSFKHPNITYYVNPNMCTTSDHPYVQIIGNNILCRPVTNSLPNNISIEELVKISKSANNRYVLNTYVYHELNMCYVQTTFYKRYIDIEPITIDNVVYKRRKIFAPCIDCAPLMNTLKNNFDCMLTVALENEIDYVGILKTDGTYVGTSKSTCNSARIENFLLFNTDSVEVFNMKSLCGLPDVFTSYRMPTMNRLRKFSSIFRLFETILNLKMLTIDNQPSLEIIDDDFLSNTMLEHCIIRNMPKLKKIGGGLLQNNKFLQYVTIENMPQLEEMPSSHILWRCPNLKRLKMTSLPNLIRIGRRNTLEHNYDCCPRHSIDVILGDMSKITCDTYKSIFVY